MNSINPTDRFSNRVGNYIKYRPSYPDSLYLFIINEIKIKEDSVLVEVGSGTGIFIEPFLKMNYKIYAVEPNEEMRSAAENILSQYKNFRSINGTAEVTTLENNVADIIFSAQAFHWFDFERCRKEFIRIRKNESTPIVLIWNERKVTTDFLKEYEELLLKFSEDYSKVDHRNINDSKLSKFYGNDNWQVRAFNNFQDFELDSFRGRVFSSSYVPAEGEKGFNEICYGLKNIFDKYNKDGIVKFEYDTNLYWGEIT